MKKIFKIVLGVFVVFMSTLGYTHVAKAETFFWPIDTKYGITTGYYGYKNHNGVDMAAGKGTPIYANFEGNAVFYQVYTTIGGKNYLTSYGNCVYLTSGDGKYFAVYAHMNAFEGYSLKISSATTKQQSGSSGKITIGSKHVSEGDLLGYVGATGNATGNHLHYGLKVNGSFVNPESYLDQSRCAHPPNPVIPDPSYSDFSVSQSIYSLHDIVEFKINPINATNMVIGIDKEGIGRVLTENCNKSNGHTLWGINLGVGSYSAYITVYNGSKHVDTNRVYFSVLPPSYSDLSVSKEKIEINENVQFNINTSHTEWMVIGIDRVGEGRVLTERCGDSVNGWSVKADTLGAGNYTAYFSLYSTNDYHLDTKSVSFSICDIRGSEMSSGYDRVLPDGDYLIANAANPQYYLDIEGNAVPAADETNVALCGPLSEEPPACDVWTIKYSNGFYRISQKDTDVSLDVYNIETMRTTNVQVHGNNDTSAQKWAISKNGRNGYRLQAKCSGYSLDVTDGQITNGANIWQYSGNDTDAQAWVFIPYKPSQDIAEGRYVLLSDLDETMELDVEGDTGDIPNETNVQIWKNTALSRYNSFDIVKLDNGYYKLIHVASGKALDLYNAGTDTGTNISLHDENGNDAQKWTITDAGGDSFILWSKRSGMVMDVENSKTVNGANVSQNTYTGGANQRWHFVKAEYSVTYDSIEGQGIPTDQTKYYMSDLKLSSSVPTREGYIFKGWNDAKDLSGNLYMAGSTYTKDADLSLYAVWEKNPVPVLTVTNNKGNFIAWVSNMDYVTECGFMYGKDEEVTLETPGRTRIVYTELDSDNSYSLDATKLTGCTIRAYVVYTNEIGEKRVKYSDSYTQ